MVMAIAAMVITTVITAVVIVAVVITTVVIITVAIAAGAIMIETRAVNPVFPCNSMYLDNFLQVFDFEWKLET